MRFISRLGLSLVLVGAASFLSLADPVRLERTLPLPLSETREAVVYWLQSNGFEVVQSEPAPAVPGRLQLEVEKPGHEGSIRLSAHSALATRVEITPGRKGGNGRWDPLWIYLEDYLKNSTAQQAAPLQALPAAVRDLRRAVVCIYWERDGTTLQLSGFAVDPQGLIVSTAHDLKLGQTVLVHFHDQRQTRGSVVKLDADRDLSLIQVPEALPTVVSLRRGHFMPAQSDTLFACGCPRAEIEVFQAGILDGPPKRVSGQPLWQVRMHIEPGSSGSPVVDEQGRLAAVVKGRYRGAHYTGFLIPFQILLDFMGKDR